MKKLSFLLLFFLTGSSFAEGPIYHHQEPEKQIEFENIYQDLRRISTGYILIGDTLQPVYFHVSSGTIDTILTVSTVTAGTITASSVTITNLTVTSTITAGTIDAVSSATITSLNVSTMNSTFIGYGRNRIINGDMRISQRHGTNTLLVNNSSTKYYVVDRFYWVGDDSAGIYNAMKLSSEAPTGFLYYNEALVLTADGAPAAGNSYLFVQRIEGIRIADFKFGTGNAVPITLSFWIRASTTGTMGGGIHNGDSSRSYPFSYVINKVNTWEWKSITIPGDTTGTWSTDTTTGFKVILSLGNGSSTKGTGDTWANASYYSPTVATTTIVGTVQATVAFTGIQLEIGNRATAFEYRPIDIELPMCQRFFEKSYAVDTATATNTATNLQYVTAAQIDTNEVFSDMIPFRVMKRVGPTMTLYSQTGVSGQWVWFSTAGVSTSRVTSILTSGTNGFTLDQAVAKEYMGKGHWVADSEY